ncbi:MULTISPECIES: nucleotidyltransferase family protein [unclassified Rathayibacter]|uniref:nucleotidyltransferase family protein n=1 Tax=unclassified Rathayibacter TaxID=2609250 RepID=UPI00188C728E|nr:MULTISPECIES: nucleotidyltransferase family protein [unclassified Rathayibacter]MBF4461885.1 nucleotidyltransferase family protein [Rathayibacter sp. VKM Ac-2879]MBF4504072.1 nucleotidyltransferase family protein [Rathayibacter sp. VKM Ac-2878]
MSADPQSAPSERATESGVCSATALLPRAVALRLAAILAQHTLRDRGIRSLVIKGEGLHRQGIRAPMASADVDLWVEPDAFDAAVALLGSLGWRRRAEALSWTLFVDHSITLVHPSWPCDIDVHRSFPGAFEDERPAFERLWAARTDLALTEETLEIPGRAHHLVLHALHQLRNARASSSATVLAALDVYGAHLPLEERLAVRDAAVELGAQTPMSVLLESWGVPAPAEERYRHAQALWDVRRRSDRHTFNWLHAIASAPWRLKGGLLLRAAFPTRADLEASHPGRLTRSRRLRLRVERTIRAVRGLPSALSGFARIARAGGHGEAAPAGSPEPIAQATAPTRLPPVPSPVAVQPAPNEHSAVVASRFVVERTEEDTYVLDLSRPGSIPVLLSVSADAIFQAVVREGRSRSATVELLAARFDADPDLLRRDVDAVLDVLDKHFPAAAALGSDA